MAFVLRYFDETILRNSLYPLMALSSVASLRLHHNKLSLIISEGPLTGVLSFEIPPSCGEILAANSTDLGGIDILNLYLALIRDENNKPSEIQISKENLDADFNVCLSYRSDHSPHVIHREKLVRAVSVQGNEYFQICAFSLSIKMPPSAFRTIIDGLRVSQESKKYMVKLTIRSDKIEITDIRGALIQ